MSLINQNLPVDHRNDFPVNDINNIKLTQTEHDYHTNSTLLHENKLKTISVQKEIHGVGVMFN